MQLNLTEDEAIALRSYITEARRNAGAHGLYASEADVVVKQINEALKPKPYTVICREREGYDDPLIYCVDISGELTGTKALAAAREARAVEIGYDDEAEADAAGDQQIFRNLLDKLEIVMAFEGDLKPAGDWRS